MHDRHLQEPDLAALPGDRRAGRGLPSSGRSKEFTKQGMFIHNSWVRFLGERRSANVTLQKSDDAALKKDLETELVQVEKYIKETDDSPNFTEQWGKFLNCERDILEYLINLC